LIRSLNKTSYRSQKVVIPIVKVQGLADAFLRLEKKIHLQ
jgi:hypothetical protein